MNWEALYSICFAAGRVSLLLLDALFDTSRLVEWLTDGRRSRRQGSENRGTL